MKPTSPKFLLIVLIVILVGCATPQPKSIPSIGKTEGWKIEEGCGSEGCYPLVDYLEYNDDLTIRVEALNGRGYVDIFVIQLMLTANEIENYTFNPSKSFVSLPGATKLEARGFPCAYTEYSHETFRSEDRLITNETPLEDNFCYYLFFDFPPPPFEEKFSLSINCLKRNGENINVPTLNFSKGKRK